MADIDLKTETPDASINDSAVLFGADSQASASPSVYSVATVRSHFVGAGSVSIASGKTLTGSNTLTLAGTDGTTMTFPATSATLARTDAGNTFTGNQTLGSSDNLNWNSDTILTRRGAANLRLGAADAAAPVAQTLSVQSGVTGASATTVSISGTALTIAGTVTGTIAIGHAVTGTGVSAGTLITAGSGTSWTVNNSQTVGPITAYFNSVGQNLTFAGSQGSGPSAGGSIVFQVAPAGAAATTAQNALATALTISSSVMSVFGQGTGGATVLLNSTNLANGKTYQFSSSVQSSTSAFIIYNSTDDVTPFSIRANASTPSIQVVSGASIGFSPSAQYNETIADVRLFRDAANTLALRNGTAAQRFNVYNTFTTSTNYEAFKIDWITTANTVLVGTEKGSGGGTARALAFQTDGTTRLTIATDGSLTLTGSGTASIANSAVVGNNNSLLLTASNYVAAETATFSLISAGTLSFWIERTTGQHMVSGFTLGWSISATNSAVSDDTILAREAAGVTAIRGANTTTGGALGFIEQTAPAAPAANGVRIYAEDDGAGKTRLMALFATGAAQQIAIEP